ncbi:UNVERIFIED_CONTAM: hypothetical protein HDU68_000846 [Siphonaria sp. JEL0065]|nr:hypothetical protein HDU68_000846 [Siphonaria sp. JEL0065]
MAAIAFWGLTCEPDSNYSQLVEQGFRLTNVAIDAKTTATKGRVSVTVSAGENEFTIANLLIGQVEQAVVDLTFNEGEEISFTVTGKATVHLTGNYIIDELDGLGDEDGEGDEEDDDEIDEDDEDDEDDGEGPEIYFDDEGNPVDKEGNPVDLSGLLGDSDDDDEDNEDGEGDDDEEDDDEDEEAEAQAAAELEAAFSKKRKAQQQAASSKQQPQEKKAKVEQKQQQQSKGGKNKKK